MPITDADVEDLVSKLSTWESIDRFRASQGSYMRALQEFIQRSREVTEYAQRTWDGLQNLPNRPQGNLDGTEYTRKQVVTMRGRVLPRMKVIKNLLDDLNVASALTYLEKDHELRSVKSFSPKAASQRAMDEMVSFKDATGGLFHMSEVFPLLHENSHYAFEEGIGPRSELDGSPFISWQTEAIEIQGVKLGPFFVCFNFSTNSVGGFRNSMPYVFPRKEATVVAYRGGHFWHPHISAGGIICWGDVQRLANEMINAGDYYTMADLIDGVLASWNPSSPYCPLIQFSPEAEKLNWLCSCGRQTFGPESSTGDGMQFFSCEACAADTCNKCLVSCRQCGMAVLCRGCQTYLGGTGPGGHDLNNLGPMCPDCADALALKHRDYRILTPEERGLTNEPSRVPSEPVNQLRVDLPF